MVKNKDSGGGPALSKMRRRIFKREDSDEDLYDQQGNSDEEGPRDEAEEMEAEEMKGESRVLPIVSVKEYEIPSDFRPYRGNIDHFGRKPLIEEGKCYEYVYVDRTSQDGNTAWATMLPNYAGEYDLSTGPPYVRLGSVMTLLRFNVEENGIEYTNLVEAPANSFNNRFKNVWIREVPCKPIEIPSLQRLTYNKLSPEVKRDLHNTLDFPEPKKGGNSVKRNKRSARKTRRKSIKNTRRNTRRHTRRNKL